jgi:hypothetical protein
MIGAATSKDESYGKGCTAPVRGGRDRAKQEATPCSR